MDELLTPIRSSSLKQTPLITPISSTHTQKQTLRLSRPPNEEDGNAAQEQPEEEQQLKPVDSADAALNLLKSSPSLQQLSSVLRYLASPDGVFDVRKPSALSSRMVNALITDVVPNFWQVLLAPEQKKEKGQLLFCLRSVSGLGGVVARIRVLTSLASSSTTEPREQLVDSVDVLERLLRGGRVAFEIWEQVYADDGSSSKMKMDITWKEFVNLVAGGRLLSVASEADMFLLRNVDGYGEEGKWVGDGKKYSAWLGRNISAMMRSLELEGEGWKALATLVSRALSLGYADDTIDSRIIAYFPEDSAATDEMFFQRIRKMLDALQPHDRTSYINSILKLLSKRHFSLDAEDDEEGTISAVASVIYALLTNNGKSEPDESIQETLTEWITGSGGPGSGEPISIRRAIIAALNKCENSLYLLQEALEKNVSNFGDKLWIRHAPVLHQEVNAQSLLLLAGYVDRRPPSYLKLLSKSSSYLQAISNRLASTNLRVRFLGMAVGEAVSKLVDVEKVQMKFSGLEEMEGEEADSWRKLVYVNDDVGDYKLLAKEKQPKKKKKKPSAPSKTPAAPIIEEIKEGNGLPEISGARIEEVDTEDDDDDDLQPYPKPDSDPEDSDDDPTLVRRNKDGPPVYIRDLIYMLMSHDSYDKQELALQHAVVLIRRKANFGTELTSHLTQLLESLVGLEDKFDMKDFDTLKLKGIVAIVVSQPVAAGKWISQRVFDGEWSLNQRCMMLSAVGLAALEISGTSEKDPSWVGKFELTEAEKNKAKFPSKRLPARLHDSYSYASTPVDALAAKLEESMVRPMAIDAADKLSGPEVLKVRKFSSRMEVEAKRKKPTPNKLGKIVAEAFFIPLMNAWSIYLQDYGVSTPHLNAHLLALYLKTLTLLLHNSGPNVLHLPQLTSSFWDLLLSLRHNPLAFSSSTVLDSILLGFLTVVDINSTTDEAKRRLAENHAKELVETQEWVTGVFEGRGGKGGEGNDEKRRALAAGILVKTREVVEKYERLLLGELIG